MSESAMLESFMMRHAQMLALWLKESDVDPLQAVLCESTIIEEDGSTTTRYWLERKQ